MSISISEERINTEAAALEIVRGEILLDLSRMLNLRDNPWNMTTLLNKLEDSTLRNNYQQLRARIVSNMDQTKQIPDYRVELYIRNYIIDPLLEDNYQLIMDALRTNLKEKFLPLFPINSVVFDEVSVNTFKLLNRQGQKPVDTLFANTLQFVSAFNVTKDFDALSHIPTREVNYYENIINSAPANVDQLKRMLTDNNFIVRVLENNCWIALDLCCKILDKVIENYQVNTWKPQDELDRLRQDFREYFRKKIVKDNRYLGKYSPKSINSQIESFCKDIWGKTRKKMNVDLDNNRRNKVVLSYKNRAMFKKSYFKLFRDEVEAICLSTLKSIPKEEIFLYDSYQKVRQNIDTLVDNSFNQVVCSMKEDTEQLKLGIQNYLNNYLNPDTKFKYKYFQLVPNFNIDDLLSLQNRKGIVMAALISTPKTYNASEYNAHLNHIANIARTLEVFSDHEIQQTFGLVSTLQNRDMYRQQIEQIKGNLERLYNDNFHLDLNKIMYIVVGLYFLVTEGERDLAEFRRAITSGDVIRLTPISYTRRRLLFQIIRFLKNGAYHVLNYHIVLLLENLIEKIRLTHNRTMAVQVLKKDISDVYHIDYNQVVNIYQKMPIIQLANLIQLSENGLKDANSQKRDELFKSSFIADTEFSSKSTIVNGQMVTVIQVDKEQTVENVSPVNKPQATPEKSPGFFGRLFFSKPKPAEPAPAPAPLQRMNTKEDDLKFQAKLQYLQENMRKLEFINLNPDATCRSRCPVICLSGFTSEDSDKSSDWKQLTSLYPFTEVLTINWEALTFPRIISTFVSSLKKVSIGSIAGMVVNQLHGIVGKENQGSTPVNSNEIPDERNPGERTVVTNPFEKANAEEEEGTGVEKEKAEPVNAGLFSLLSKNKIKDIFTAENLTMVT